MSRLWLYIPILVGDFSATILISILAFTALVSLQVVYDIQQQQPIFNNGARLGPPDRLVHTADGLCETMTE